MLPDVQPAIHLPSQALIVHDLFCWMAGVTRWLAWMKNSRPRTRSAGKREQASKVAESGAGLLVDLAAQVEPYEEARGLIGSWVS
jgi:hypothetical protein